MPVAQVEQRILDGYRVIERSAAQRKRREEVALTELHLKQQPNETLSADLEAEAAKIKSHQAKLLDANYADAIPKDLFLSEQRRLQTELARIARDQANAETDLTALRQELTETLHTLEDARAYYAQEPISSEDNSTSNSSRECYWVTKQSRPTSNSTNPTLR